MDRVLEQGCRSRNENRARENRDEVYSDAVKPVYRFSGCQNISPRLKIVTSTSQRFANQNTSFVVVATSSISKRAVAPSPHPSLDGFHIPLSPPSFHRREQDQSQCDFSSDTNELLDQRRRLSLPLSTSDDDMNAGSPDSGFESTTPNGCPGVDYFDERLKEDTCDESSKSSISTSTSATSEVPLCLIPQPKPIIPEVKPEPSAIACKWKDCDMTFPSKQELHVHLNGDHIDLVKSRICCLWSGCKVFNKEARNTSFLRQHVAAHTGVKRFKCVLDGCDASFSSQSGLYRHVHSHFNEVNLPKARLANNIEKRFLVKRRRIKDERKALANIHDCMDQRSLNLMTSSLVELAQTAVSTSTKCCEKEVLCKRLLPNSSKWHLSDNRCSWSQDNAGGKQTYDGVLFFATPTARCRKRKIPVSH